MNKLRVIVLGLITITFIPACSSSEKGKGEYQETQPRVIRISVGTDGFTPESIATNADEPVVLEFLRTTDNTCATGVIFSDTQLSYDLPLNKPVRISARLRQNQQLSFACPMDMYSGNVTVRGEEHFEERVGRQVASEDFPKIVSILVNKDGFSPAAITLRKGKPVTLRFKRVTDQTCATRVVIPTLKIERELPLNEEVDIEILPKETGDIGFACHMDMVKGNIKVNL